MHHLFHALRCLAVTSCIPVVCVHVLHMFVLVRAVCVSGWGTRNGRLVPAILFNIIV